MRMICRLFSRPYFLSVILWVCILDISSDAYGSPPPPPSSSEDLSRRAVWSQELNRLATYCFNRPERSEPTFGGCRSRVDAINALWASFRTSRLQGFASRALDSQQASALKIALRNTFPTSSQEERASLIHLSGEALRATGDASWLEFALQIIPYSPWMGEAPRCTLGESCVDELIAILSLSSLLQQITHPIEAIELPSISLAGQLLSKREILVENARKLTLAHPMGHLSSDSQRKSAVSWWTRRARLAANIYSPKELLHWWHSEARSESDLQPVSNLAPQQWGIHFDRAAGLGALLSKLGESAEIPSLVLSPLEVAFQSHALSGMQLYLEKRRDQRSYAKHIPARGVIALTSDRSENHLSLDHPPRRWRMPLKVIHGDLPAEGIRASGMFSELMVRDQEFKRGLYFIRPRGEQLLETEVDLTRPEFLQVRYTQDMLAVYPCLSQNPRQALLIGLGGGAMVHALHAYDPQLKLDVVEIDPVVVRFARDYFGITQLEMESAQQDHWLNVITEDGFHFLNAETSKRYDIIWMDAFLQPSEDTDSTGSPLNLKTRDFLRAIAQRKLTPQGVIAINLNHHEGLSKDIRSIRAAFPASSIWQVPMTGNYIAIGFNQPPASPDEMLNRASSLRAKQATPFRYTAMIDRVLEGLELNPNIPSPSPMEAPLPPPTPEHTPAPSAQDSVAPPALPLHPQPKPNTPPALQIAPSSL